MCPWNWPGIGPGIGPHVKGAVKEDEDVNLDVLRKRDEQAGRRRGHGDVEAFILNGPARMEAHSAALRRRRIDVWQIPRKRPASS